MVLYTITMVSTYFKVVTSYYKQAYCTNLQAEATSLTQGPFAYV